MEPRIQYKESIGFSCPKVQAHLKKLNEQLAKQKADNEALNEKHRLDLEYLVAERTKDLQVANLTLRKQIDEKHKIEQQLYFEAHHDVLTRLPNRALLSDRLTYAISRSKRHPNQKFAVLFIDLDRFKMINDTLGHHVGDTFLIEITNRLRSCVRDNDVLARLGGDEFVVLLDSVTSDDAEEVASRIIASIEQPYSLENNTLYSSASIGIALGNAHYKNAVEILRDADAAMYQAKSLGRGRFVFFDESMRTQLMATMTLEQELREAIDKKQLELHYQAISNLDSTKTMGFEALLRWNHPTRGLLTPSDFLYLAEETGIILTIEKWLIEEVARQLDVLKYDSEYQHAFVAINLSGKHLTQASELNNLVRLIKQHIFEPHKLILEFKEAAFNQNADFGLNSLKKLKNLGVKLALDDYASGVSSFNYLHKYPFEFIKLDRTLIQTLQNSNKNLPLIKALSVLGDEYGYRLVAEGIENFGVMQKLHAVGCDFGQGYHISKPEKLQKNSLICKTKSCA